MGYMFFLMVFTTCQIVAILAVFNCSLQSCCPSSLESKGHNFYFSYFLSSHFLRNLTIWPGSEWTNCRIAFSSSEHVSCQIVSLIVTLFLRFYFNQVYVRMVVMFRWNQVVKWNITMFDYVWMAVVSFWPNCHFSYDWIHKHNEIRVYVEYVE